METALKIVYQPQAVFRVRPVARCTASLPGHAESVLAVSFSPNGRHPGQRPPVTPPCASGTWQLRRPCTHCKVGYSRLFVTHKTCGPYRVIWDLATQTPLHTCKVGNLRTIGHHKACEPYRVFWNLASQTPLHICKVGDFRASFHPGYLTSVGLHEFL